jgi:two-component system nitrogen regulation sensor histidine kinase GlnL
MHVSTCQRILENLSTAVLVLDGDLRLRWINPAAEILFEISANQVAGESLNALLPGSRRFTKTLRHILDTGHPLTERGLRLSLLNARTITVDCSVSLLSGDHGERELLVEMDQVDRLLRLTREEALVEQHTAQRAVIRGLAHEIKNPLGGLRGAAQLLERELPDRELKEYTRIIIHEADRLRNLVDHLVGPNRPLNRRPLNIHEVFEHVRRLLLAEFPSLTIDRDYDPSLPDLSGDAEQLVQAVLNIVRNAAQAVEYRGRVCLRTRVERQFTIGQKRHRLVLRAEVEDDGPGIRQDLVDHIFYPMVTGRAEGTGLGLSIAQAIVHQHGGLIQCSSRPRQTIFTIYLPLEHAHG